MRLSRRRQDYASGQPTWRPIPAWSWMLTAVIAVGLTAFAITAWLLAIASHAKLGTDLVNAKLDAVRTGLAAGAGAGAAVGLMLAFRRQHHQEISTALTDHDATQRRITELYTKAVEQLGSGKAPVRLGGLYALERLAQDNQQQRQTIVNVICAYLRMPFPPQAPDSAPPLSDNGNTARVDAESSPAPSGTADSWQQEKQVRLTAQRILTEHLRRLDRDEQADSLSYARFWDGIRLDLNGATLFDFSLHYSLTIEALFHGAIFSGDAVFNRATFNDDAVFDQATFNGNVMFIEATFSGDAVFDQATFNGNAVFSGATFSGAGFGGATFSGDAQFYEATFKGTAWFGKATFNDNAGFSGATFSGGAQFYEATFNGNAAFDGAIFSGDTRFDQATFNGDATFDQATFNNDFAFGDATFSGDARFVQATFNGRAAFGATFKRPSAIAFNGAKVRSRHGHVWPKGWQVSDDSSGKLTVARSSSSTSP